MRGASFCLIVLLGALLVPSVVGAAEPVANEAECPEVFFGGLGPVNCFTVAIPERHEAPDGRHITLFVSILCSTADDPMPDPVVYLAGGPGSPAAEAASGLAESMADVRATRDIILLEQRGTALADPYLGCPALDRHEGFLTAWPEDAETTKLLIGGAARECAEAHEAAGTDLSAYSTAQNAADVESVRLGLAIEEWNLYGTSYGTRLGLEVLRSHPGAVRSAVFDSVYAPGSQLYRDRTPNLARAVAAATAACDADAACRARFGSLNVLLQRALDRWRDTPGEAFVPTGEDSVTPVLIDAGTVASVVFSQLVSDPVSLPLALEALADGRTHVIELSAVVPGLNAEGMRLSVECAEGFARLDTAAQAAADAEHPDLALAFRSFPEMIACDAWPVSAVDGGVPEPVASDVPALLISGAFDPITPPAAAELATETLTDARLYVVPFGGHGAGLTDPCAIAARDAFFADPADAGPVTCESAGGPFATDVAAHAGAVRAWTEIWLRTRPWARAPFEAIFGAIGLVCASMVVAI